MKTLFTILTTLFCANLLLAQTVSRAEHPVNHPVEKVAPKAFSHERNNSSSMGAKGQASTCGNLDFEDKNYGGWSLFKGSNLLSTNPPANVVVDSFPSLSGQHYGIPSGGAFHAIVDSANSSFLNSSIDQVSPYQKKNIARLNHLQTGAKAAIIERQVAVTNNNAFLHFSYFVVFDNAGHSQSDQPYFNFAIFDSTNTAITGATLNIVAGSNTATPNPGFVSAWNGQILYKPWTPVTVDLTAYVGQTITLQFIAADCSQGGHGGYALLDFDCGGTTAAVPNVWPGDANYDLNVNYLDMFYIGAGFGQTGSARTSQGNSWAAAPSNNWANYSMYLVNSKHADCNGDGVIGTSDTTAIFANYGLTHVFKSNATHLVAQNKSVPKHVSIYSSSVTLSADQPFTIFFDIGSLGNEVDSIYAIGLKMSYPSHLINPAFSKMDCGASVVGTLGSNMLNGFKPFVNDADLVITKTDHVNTTNVAGNLFALNLRTSPLINATEAFKFEILGMHAITRSGKTIELDSDYMTVDFLASNAVSVAEIDALRAVQLYPNPVNDVINITSGVKLTQYTIYTIQGRQVGNGTVTASQINVGELAPGCYFVQIETEMGQRLTKRVIVE